MDDALSALVARRRDRAIAAILGVKEREADRYLPPEARQRLRKVVLDQINDFASLIEDVLDSLAEGQAGGSTVVLNSLWLDKIDQIHQAVTPADGA